MAQAPYNYVVDQPDANSYFDAVRRGRADRQAVEQDQRNNALARYLPQALQGDAGAQQQAINAGSPDQMIQLKQTFAQMDAPKLQAVKDLRAKGAAGATWAKTPEQWATVQATLRAEAQAAGLPFKEVPFEQKDAMAAMGQTVDSLIDQAYKEKMLANDTSRTQAQNAASYASAAASRAAAGRGGKAPTGYTWSQDGMSLVPIPGGPADPATKPMNEGQSNALGFANRIRSANEILNGPDAASALGDSVTQGFASIPLAGNYLAGQNFQQADQAVRDFINAQLRRESGAAIGTSEFENAYKQYIPRPGDGPKVLEQKKRARELALQNMLLASGPGGLKAPAATPAQPAPVARPGQASQPGPMQNGVPVVRTQAEFNALPSGAVYVEPDGKKYRKP